MYIYFDSNGVLREIINDKAVRQGDLNANEVLVYIENIEPADIWITFRKPGGAFSTEKSFITNKITKEIPYNKNRDMRYFKDLTEYTFYKFVISDEITEAGTYEATIRFTYADSLVALGKFVFNAEPSVIKQDNLITQAQYNYLIWYVGSWQGQIGNLASGIATLNSEITTIKSRLDTNEANITNLLSNYVKKTSLTTNSSQSIKPVVNGDFITFEIRNLQSSDNLIKTDNENGIYVSANGVISLVSARIVSDSNLRNAIKGVVYEVGTTKDWQSGTQVNSKITTHDENTTAHAYLRGLINDISQEIARIDARGRSYGELDKTLSELLLESDKDLYIYNYLTNKYSGYENQVGNLIYTKVSDNEPEHELEYNGTNWVDNGAYLISKADNTQFGMVKGDNEYISILNGLIQVLKSDYATRLGTSGANYTYSDLLNTLTQFATDIANRYTKAETLFELEQRITDLLGMADLQDILIGSYTNGQTVLASDLSPYNFVIALGRDVDNTYTGTFKPSEIVNGNVISLSSTVYLTRGATDFTITTPTSVKLWGIKLTADKVISKTYAEMVKLKNDGGLTPGQQYRITNYETTTTQHNTQSAGHAFDLIVVADSPNKLNEQARAIQHEGDTYFANSKLEAWQVWYSLDNDVTRFAWADSVNGKGVIYRMIDEWNNDCPYDFKNIQFLRDGVYYYTFTAFENTDETIKDASIMREMVADDMVEGMTYNSMKPHYIYVDDNVYPQALNFNIFKSYYDDGDIFYMPSNNHFELNCYNNFFDGTEFTSNNTFGNYVYGNSFGNYVSYNTFGNSVSNNTFGNYVYNNTFGNDVGYNTFGDYCYYNTFGNGVSYNTFGNYVYNNTFGDNANNNSFGDYFWYNTVKNGVRYVSTPDATHPNYFQYVTLENGLAGASGINKLNLDGIKAVVGNDTPIKVARGTGTEIIAVWQDGAGDTNGKYKNNNLDNVWKTIPQEIEGGTF